MSRHSHTKLVPPNTEPKNEVFETMQESCIEPKEEPAMSGLDMEIQCPRCNEIMELCSSFDKLIYSCESCSFLLRFV
jgi:uncharacterized protein (DUF983 family)